MEEIVSPWSCLEPVLLRLSTSSFDPKRKVRRRPGLGLDYGHRREVPGRPSTGFTATRQPGR